MRSGKKIVAALIVFTFFTFSTKAFADEMMQSTLRDTLYGGMIGAILGSALVLLENSPSKHLDYIPKGAAIGVIIGAGYGVISNAPSRPFGEIEGGKFTASVPTIKRAESFDRNSNTMETTASVDLLGVRF